MNRDKSRREMRSLVAELSRSEANFELTFFGKFRCRVNDKRITIHNRRFNKAEFQALIPTYDYILQPYLKGSYELKASGILFDAINYQVPLLTTTTPFTRYYFDLLGDIGLISETQETLRQNVLQAVSGLPPARLSHFQQNLFNAREMLDSLNGAMTI